MIIYYTLIIMANIRFYKEDSDSGIIFDSGIHLRI